MGTEVEGSRDRRCCVRSFSDITAAIAKRDAVADAVAQVRFNGAYPDLVRRDAGPEA